MRKLLIAAAFLLATVGSSQAATINFDDQGLSGPDNFGAATPQSLNLNIGGVNVNITGGTVLTAATNLPSNTSSLYGTADFFTGGQNPIVITFSESITNFFLDVFNGEPANVTYVVSDNAGNSSTFTLPGNFSGGFTTVGFAATGTMVSIFANPLSSGAFDFLIDNIHFNEPLPTSSVPLPAGLPLLLSGVALLALLRRKQASA